jgi:hypothetical protein
LNLATMYLRRVRVVGRAFAATLKHVSTVVTPPAPAAQNFGVLLRQTCWGEAFRRRRAYVQRSNINITGIISTVVS